MATQPPQSIRHLAYTVYPFLKSQINHICSMPLKTRSLLIKCCQAQSYPLDRHAPLRQMLKDAPHYIVTDGGRTETCDPRNTFAALRPLISGPVTSSILLDLARSLPVMDHEIDEARIASWRKEGIKVEEESRSCQINWAPIFDPSRAEEPMLPFLTPNKGMALEIYSCLTRWRKKVCSRVLHPRSTRKNMSRATRREFEYQTGISLENTPIFSQEDWLRFYHREGIKLGGATEMRQKWYPSGAKPRTYFAQGGFHYGESASLQDVFTDLVNCCPITHHVTRLQPTRLVRREGEHYRIYDLSTFTSNMAEQRGFVKALAEFCYGWEVMEFDVRDGLRHRDLGDMIDNYYETCVMYPELSVERVPGVKLDLKDEYHITTHEVASMLGIFGNLMTCTFAHGSIMAMTVEASDLINVAGDDGIVLETPDNEDEIDWTIGVLGEYERTKTFRSDDEGAICLKRPLREVIGGLEHDPACIPPSLITTAFYIWSLSDARYSFHRSDLCGQPIGYSVVGKDWMRFLRSVFRWNWRCDDDQLSYAATAFNQISAAIRAPTGGGLPHCGDTYFWPTRMTVEDLRSTDPLDVLIGSRYAPPIALPVMEYEEEVLVDSSLSVGDVFVCNSSWVLGLLCKLGYLERKSVHRMSWGYEGYERLRRLLTSWDPLVYEFTVVEDIPEMFY